jgi:hypothetical protein
MSVPQIVIAASVGIDLLIAVSRHKQSSQVNAYHVLISKVALISVLSWGGFF